MTSDGVSKELQLIRCYKGEEEVLSKVSVDTNLIRLKVQADKQDLNFEYSYDGKDYKLLKSNVDGRILSTDVAGGFVGNTIGLYCSSNGQESDNHSDFDWLSYKSLD